MNQRCPSNEQKSAKHWCVISAVLVTDTEDSTVQVSTKKINSFPVRFRI